MKRTMTYEVDVCDACGYERIADVRRCVACDKEGCASCAPMGSVGLEPPVAHDAKLSFPASRWPVCFDCAPAVAERLTALLVDNPRELSLKPKEAGRPA